MSTFPRWLALGIVIIFVAVHSGCNREQTPTLAKVSGVVKYKGQPVEGATVSYTEEKATTPAGGKTDAQGRYSFDAVVGMNKITVTKTEGGATMSVDPEEMKKNPGASMGASAKAFQEAKPLTHLLPRKYSAVQSTTFTAQVEKDKENVKDLELED